jgi:carboxyl-terminal processing protease
MNFKSLKSSVYLPVAFALVLALGVFIGSRLNQSFMRPPVFAGKVAQFNKLNEVVNYIQQEYVDTINEKTLVDESITAILDHLDPHSAYIPAEDLQAANEPLEGNFDGIGVEFHLQNDTIMVVTPISGGPSEAVGIMPGDRIIKVDGKSVAGISISSTDVMQKIRGASGSKVKLTVIRKGKAKPMDFDVTRGKIPIYSVDISYMIDKETGYIKISRFAATTYDEYKTTFKKLKADGLKNLILDLRGNPGGYLNIATKLADEFLSNKKLIVYTERRF